MLISATKLRPLTTTHHHILPHLHHFTTTTTTTPSTDHTLTQISTLIKQPNWHQNPILKPLLSHLPPETASKIITLHSHNPHLCLHFYKHITKHSTYCHTITSKLRLINKLLHSNLFTILHNVLVVFVKDCSTSTNDMFKALTLVDDMRNNGFVINYSTYSTLLMCLSKVHLGYSGFLVYRKMTEDGFVLSGIDYRNLINGLCKNGFVSCAEMFVGRVVKSGFGVDVYVSSSLVLGYCRRREMKDAFHVFDGMLQRDGCGVNEVTFTVLIHGLCEVGEIVEAFRLKEDMEVEGCRPSTRTYTVLIKAVCDVGSIDEALCLLDEMVKKGCEPNAYTFTILIDGLCKEGRIEEANGMFRKMMKDGLIPGTVTFNALINGYCKQGRVVSAFELLSMMEKRNSRPNIRTYNELMEGLCRIGKPYKAMMMLLRKIIDNGLWPERLTFNILVDGFCKEGQLDMAFEILKSIDSLNLISDGFAYTTVIDRLSKDGKLDQANGVLGLMMKKGIDPDEVTYTALIDGYCKNGKIRNAVMLLDRIVRKTNLTLTGPQIFNSLIDAFGKDTKLGQENAMFGKMLKCGVTPSVVTYTILIDGFCQTGNMDRSLEVFELMKKCKCSPNVYTFTVLIDGFCQTGRIKEAVKLLHTMSNTGVSPNIITYTILIKAYVKFGNLEHGFEMLNDMVKTQCQPNFETLSALLEGLIRSDCVTNGSITAFKEMGSNHAVEFFQKAKKNGVGVPDLYNFLILGLYKVGRIPEGDELVQEMMKNSYFPDVSVCCKILEHLCHKGKYDDCVVMMKLMFDHGVTPSFASYCSLVHGLRKEGRVREVKDLMSDLLSKAGVEDKDGVLTYMEFLVDCDEYVECVELLDFVEKSNHQETPII